MLNVIADLSPHNDPVDFAQVAQSGLLGVVHKATEGLADVDPTSHARRPLAQGAGLLWGVPTLAAAAGRPRASTFWPPWAP